MEHQTNEALSLLTQFGNYVATMQLQREEKGSSISGHNMDSVALEFLRNKALYDLCKSTINDFGSMPVEFEFNDALYDFDEIEKLLTDNQHKELSALIEAKTQEVQ